MKKRIVLVLCMVTLLITAMALAVACDIKKDDNNDNKTVNEKFYKYDNGQYYYNICIELIDKNTWTDGSKEGEYNVTGNKIKFLIEGVEVMSGTLADNILTIDIDGDRIVYKKEYSIKFHLNDENEEIIEKITEDGKVTYIPTRKGYTFDGWWTSNNNGSNLDKKWNLDTKFTNNTELWAKWNLLEYSITYHLDGGKNSSENPLKYSIESKEIVLKAATKAGYTFDGWYFDSNYTKPANIISAELLRNLELYAHYIPYEISVDGNGDVTILGYSGSDKEVEIPSTIFNGKVISIGDNAFKDNTNITNIVIPNCVTFIGESAFSGCTGLTNVIVPNSVTIIEKSAFEGCNSLTEITIPFVGNKLEGTNYTHFSYIFGNDGAKVPKSLTSVKITGGNRLGSFSKCTNIADISIPDSIVFVAKGVLDDTAWYNNQPDGVVYIGKVAYKYKGNMPSKTSIVLDEGTKAIAEEAFYNCSNLVDLTVPDSVVSIGKHAFTSTAWNNTYYKSQPDGVVYVGKVAYRYKGSLPSDKTIIIKDGTLGIAGGAFNSSDFYGMNISMPSSIMNIGGTPFYPQIGAVKRIDIVDISNWCEISFYDSNSNPLSHPTADLYLNGELVTDLEIPYGVSNISSYAFYQCSSLTSVNIPDSVTSIGECAFQSCGSLTSVSIPNSVKSIGNSAFSYCSSLASVTIPDSVTYLGLMAFDDCYNLTNATIGKGVTSIGRWTFYGCYSLEEIELSNGLREIGEDAFDGCSGLTSISIPNSVVSIEGGAFDRCKSLTSINIPSSVTSITGSAFSNCDNLTSIIVEEGNTKYHSNGNCIIETDSKTLIAACAASIIPTDGSVTSIGAHAFSSCDSLTSITIPNSVTSIGEYAFSGRSSLTSITIPNGVTSIGEYAFYGCSSLTSIIIPDRVTIIGYGAFGYCTSLTTLAPLRTKSPERAFSVLSPAPGTGNLK